jgi:hypothetical protein
MTVVVVSVFCCLLLWFAKQHDIVGTFEVNAKTKVGVCLSFIPFTPCSRKKRELNNAWTLKVGQLNKWVVSIQSCLSPGNGQTSVFHALIRESEVRKQKTRRVLLCRIPGLGYSWVTKVSYGPEIYTSTTFDRDYGLRANQIYYHFFPLMSSL